MKNKPLPFRDLQQRSRVCRILLDRVQLPHFFTAEGPTSECVATAEAVAGGHGTALSREQAIVLRVVMFCWTGERGGLDVADVFELDGMPLKAVAILLLSTNGGADGIELWIDGQISFAVVDAHGGFRGGGCESLEEAFALCGILTPMWGTPLFIRSSDGEEIRYDGPGTAFPREPSPFGVRPVFAALHALGGAFLRASRPN